MEGGASLTVPVFGLIIGIVLALVLGVLIGYIIRKNVGEKVIGSAEQQAKNLILDAKNHSETIRKEITLEAKEEAHKIRDDADKEVRERRSEVARQERRIQQKEEAADRKLEQFEKREKRMASQEQEIERKKQKAEETLQQQVQELERISGYTAEDAKQIILEKVEKDCRHEASRMIKEIESQAKEEADEKAKNIITGAIQRCAADQVAESTLSVVNLPNDDMKGRIIGREGRNIRAIETLTGVDLIIDDTPEAVIISGFDPIRREVARIALEKLVMDGRIHPAKIEEMVEKARREVAHVIKEEGEQATFETGIHNLHPELVKLLGRLHFRTSYGQNVLQHSIEVSHLAGLMAGELGLNVKLAKRAGLLHDIGKALDHEYEGTHVDIGIQILKKYKESSAVINCMASHHGDYEPKCMEAVLIAAADALSAARPGARRETLDVYVKRLEKLEDIANTTPGVSNSYAIQAGREIRIIVNPDEVPDDEMPLLARNVSKRIESELEYPGQIKVNVVRETKAVDYAK
ncbi:MAG: ribonuclease Y [Eubacterium sp.]|jgi:ribonuclease Y|uniref:ribonuclease Y n=1 Tax=Eubacterium sp. F2 TaxID=3381348 RepID=UPI003907F1E5|nr:ribonuclease Y [Eubacterium sp.]